MQMQPPALPRGTITGVFLRPPGAAGSEIFERCAQADGVEVGLGLLGLQGSQEWHRLEKSAGKLSSADAADRAVLMQVHAAIARVMREHPITPPPLHLQCEAHAQQLLQAPPLRFARAINSEDVLPGAFGENVRVQHCAGSRWDSGSLCIGARVRREA